MCYTSKLRCSGEKPACARCQKGKVVCTYAPTKRPGRPRKNATKGVCEDARTTAASRAPSSSVAVTVGTSHPSLLGCSSATQRISNFGIDEPLLMNVDMQWAVDGIGEGFDLDWPDHLTSAGVLDNDALIDDLVEQGSNSQPPVSLLNGHWDLDRANLDTGHAISPASLHSWANRDVSPRASDANDSTGEAFLSGLPDSTGFSVWCNSLNQWISARGAPRFDAAPMESGALCLCPMALMTLQLHRKSICKGQALCSLEAPLHLQRLLRWTWDLCKDCPWCGEDNVTKLLVAAIAKELAGAYRNIITADERRRKEHQSPSGLEHAAKRRAVSFADHTSDGHILSAPKLNAPPEATYCFTGKAALKLGHKPIEGVAKATFLRRVISLRLQELSLLVRELSVGGKLVDSNRAALVQPLELLVLGVLEHVDVMNGML